jgi:hypothetical protein
MMVIVYSASVHQDGERSAANAEFNLVSSFFSLSFFCYLYSFTIVWWPPLQGFWPKSLGIR